jgi:hypothetical protein
MDSIIDQFDAAEPEATREPEPPPATLDLELDPPIEFQKKTFTVLHLREPRSGETQRALAELANGSNPYTQHRMATRLVAAVAQVPVEVVLKMPEGQVRRAMDFFERIGNAGQATGETSSPT